MKGIKCTKNRTTSFSYVSTQKMPREV